PVVDGRNLGRSAPDRCDRGHKKAGSIRTLQGCFLNERSACERPQGDAACRWWRLPSSSNGRRCSKRTPAWRCAEDATISTVIPHGKSFDPHRRSLAPSPHASAWWGGVGGGGPFSGVDLAAALPTPALHTTRFARGGGGAPSVWRR